MRVYAPPHQFGDTRIEKEMGNAQLKQLGGSSPCNGADDILSARWSILNALKQQQSCDSTFIIPLFDSIIEIHGKNALTNLQDGSGRTLLMLCIDRKLPEAVEYLLNMAVDVDLRAKDNCYKWSAIMYAVSRNQFQIVKKLIELNCDIDEKDQNGMTCLMQASLQGFFEIAELLVKSGAELNAVYPLLYRSSKYFLLFLIMNFILLMVQVCKSGGLSALMLATRRGNRFAMKEYLEGSFRIIQLLIKSGADTEIISNSRKKAIDYMSDNDEMKEFYEVTIQSSWYDTDLHKAVHQNNIVELKALLERDTTDIDKKGKNGWTALHTAAFCNRQEALEMLLTKDASLLADNIGRTPLHIICQRKNLQMISVIYQSFLLRENDKNGDYKIPWWCKTESEAQSRNCTLKS